MLHDSFSCILNFPHTFFIHIHPYNCSAYLNFTYCSLTFNFSPSASTITLEIYYTIHFPIFPPNAFSQLAFKAQKLLYNGGHVFGLTFPPRSTAGRPPVDCPEMWSGGNIVYDHVLISLPLCMQ